MQPDQDKGVTSKYILGSANSKENPTEDCCNDNPNFMYLKFQKSNSQWFYWYVRGKEVHIRPAGETEVIDSEVFRTMSPNVC